MGLFSRLRLAKIPQQVVLQDAAEIRRRYGWAAELWCEDGIRGAPSHGTRRMLQQIQKALASFPAEPATEES